MEKIILPAFRSNVQDVPEEISKPGWRLPLYIFNDEGIDLDFGPLLLFDQAIISTESFEFIQNSEKPYLTPIKESIRILYEEGYIELIDFKPLLKDSREQVGVQTNKAIENPREWTSPILRSLSGWEKQLPNLRNVIGMDKNHSGLHSEFGTYVYLMKRDGKILEEEESRIIKLFRTKKKRMLSKELDELREIVKPTVSYIHTNIAISEMLETPFIDVDFSSELYGMVYQKAFRNLNPSILKPLEKTNVASQLFNLAIPHLRPSSPIQMINLLKDKRILNFREFVTEIAVNKEIIDSKALSQIQSEAIKAERGINKIRGKIKWTGRAISLIPFSTPLVMFGEEAAEKYLNKKNGKFNWLYALIDNVL